MHDLGSIPTVWFVRFSTILVLGLGAPLFKQRIAFPQREAIWYLFGMGIIDTIAFVLYGIVVTQNTSPTINVIVSLFSIVTIILTRIFLRERLSIHQWLGIAFILLGIGCMNT